MFDHRVTDASHYEYQPSQRHGGCAKAVEETSDQITVAAGAYRYLPGARTYVYRVCACVCVTVRMQRTPAVIRFRAGSFNCVSKHDIDTRRITSMIKLLSSL